MSEPLPPFMTEPPTIRRTRPRQLPQPGSGGLATFADARPKLTSAIKSLTMTPIIGPSFALIGRHQSAYWAKVHARVEATCEHLHTEVERHLRCVVSRRLGDPSALDGRAPGGAIDSTVLWRTLSGSLANLGEKLAFILGEGISTSYWEKRTLDNISVDLSALRNTAVTDLASRITHTLRDLQTLLPEVSPAEQDALSGARERLQKLLVLVTVSRSIDLAYLQWLGDLLWYTLTYDNTLALSEEELGFLATLHETDAAINLPLSLSTTDGSTEWLTAYLGNTDSLEIPPSLDDFNDRLATYLCLQWRKAQGVAKQAVAAWPIAVVYTLDRVIEDKLCSSLAQHRIKAFHVLAPFVATRLTGPGRGNQFLVWLMAKVTNERDLDDPEWEFVNDAAIDNPINPEGPIIIRPRGAVGMDLPGVVEQRATTDNPRTSWEPMRPWVTVSSWEYLSLFILADNMPSWFDEQLALVGRSPCLLGPRLDEWTKKLVVQDSLFGNKSDGAGRDLFAVAPDCAEDETRWLELLGVVVYSGREDLAHVREVLGSLRWA